MRTNPPVPEFRFRATGLTTSISLLLATVPALAQTIPDAGSLQQQIQRERITTLPGPAAPQATRPSDAQRPPPGATVVVREFQFSGNTLLKTEQLAEAVRVYLSRPLDFNQLQGAVFAVTGTYRQAGWVVRAFLPAQDVKDGIVRIQIVEATYGGASVAARPGGRVDRSQVIAGVDAQLKKGAPLAVAALDRALLLADDLPGVTVSGALTEGKAERESAVGLTLGDEPLLRASLALDNHGPVSTGTSRLAWNGSVNSPLRLGDQLTAGAQLSEGSSFLRVGYSLPVGNDGWRAGLNASGLQYRLIAPEFVTPVDLKGRGNSQSAGADLTYPLIRARQHNVYFGLTYNKTQFDNELGGTTTTRYTSDQLTIGLDANRQDGFGGGGYSTAALTYSAGQLNLDGSPNFVGDAGTTRTNGRFNKLRYSASRTQTLATQWLLTAAFSGQAADKNLDSSERFYLGGANSVRAYPSNEGGGTSGNLLNLDVAWRATPALSLGAFYDYGEVRVNQNNNFTNAPALNNYSLQGAGLSLAVQGPRGSVVKALWARRIGDNPNATVTGNDQDGTLVRDRFWITANLSY